MASASDRQFRALYDEHFRAVLAYCLRRMAADDAYDAANEVFATAWRRIGDVPKGDATLPWLYVVARRVIYRGGGACGGSATSRSESPRTDRTIRRSRRRSWCVAPSTTPYSRPPPG